MKVFNLADVKEYYQLIIEKYLGTGPSYVFHSAMGQAFAVATVAWVGCFIITILVSLLTKPKEEKELVGLVYSLTPKLQDAKSPVVLAIVMIILGLILNLIFF